MRKMNNDRFKFRLWNKENNKYEDDLYYEAGDLQVACVNKIFEEYFSDGCIIEQCTGLKDKNGKLIYEGDIVQTDYEGVGLDKYIYRWEEPAFYLEPIENGKLTGSHYYYYAICVERCVVIGNIHENPELLKG